MFFGRNDAFGRNETPVLWPPHAKSWLIGKHSDAGRDWGQEEKGMTEDEMAGWHHRLDGREFEWTLAVSDGQGGLACCGSWGRKDRLNWTELKREKQVIKLEYIQYLLEKSVLLLTASLEPPIIVYSTGQRCEVRRLLPLGRYRPVETRWAEPTTFQTRCRNRMEAKFPIRPGRFRGQWNSHIQRDKAGLMWEPPHLFLFVSGLKGHLE